MVSKKLLLTLIAWLGSALLDLRTQMLENDSQEQLPQASHYNFVTRTQPSDFQGTANRFLTLVNLVIK
jgi:hypothetical protein